MILLQSSGRYEAKASYEDRHVLKASGFRWCPASKAWWTGDDTCVERLRRSFPGEVSIHQPQEQAEIAIPSSWEGHPSCATDGPDDIPCPPGLAYLPYQRGGIAFARGKDGVLIADQPGLGKAQPVDEPVLTPSGFVSIGSLKVGDLVVGADGRPTEVTGVFPQGIKKVRRVVMSDGSWTRCCDEHLWKVQSKNQRLRGAWKVQELKDIRIKESCGNANAYIPMVQPVRYHGERMPLDPWLVGMLIGDGCLRRNAVCVSNPEDDVLRAVDAALPPGMEMKHAGAFEWRLVWKRGQANVLLAEMRKFGLMWKGSHERFVPELYKRVSPENRLAVLQGLFDSDGTPADSIGTIEYCTTSERLALDVQEMVFSLGGTCQIYDKLAPAYSHNGEKRIGRRAWRCYVKLPDGMEPFCHSGQKIARQLAGKRQRSPYRSIKEIQDDGRAECVCISVAAADRLYVTRHFIVTHNTIQAIGVMNDSPVKTALIICPASIKDNWAREVDKWLNYYRPIHVVVKAAHPLPREIGVLIVNYDIVAKLRPRLDLVAWDILICDESHLLKTPTAKRTQAVLGRDGRGGIAAGRRVFLTGTPAESRPAELFTVANALRPDVFPNWLDFALRYCGAFMGKYGLEARGATHVAELQAKLRETIMVRRKKSDVLRDLPPKINVRVTLPCDAKLRASVDAELAGYQRERALIESLKAKGASVEAVTLARNAANARMRDLRLATTAGKLPMALDFIRNAADAEKVVVFAVHHDVLDALQKEFKGRCVVITGKTPVGERQALVDRFQNDPEVAVFIGQIIAAGVGLTLTASSHVIFVEYDWRPGVIEQASDRCHRIGQQDSVTCSYLVIEKSLDDVMLSSVQKKKDTLHETLDI